MVQHEPLTLLRMAQDWEQALFQSWGGREQAWLDELTQDLAELKVHLEARSTPSEHQLLAPVEGTKRERSPGLAREVQGLRSDSDDLLDRVDALEKQLQRASTTNRDILAIHLAGWELLQELRQVDESESKLVLETAMRDTGGEN